MFGSFTGTKSSPGVDFGEQMLSSVASQCLRHLFTRSESIDVTVRCHPSSKLLQGSIDNFKMQGRGLVIRKDFYTESMSFETDAVSIDFSSVLSGKIRLKQPTQAVAQVTLTEAGINQAFKAELVTQRLLNINNPALAALSGDEPVSFSDVELKLLPDSRVKIFAKAELPNGIVPVSLSATLAVERRRRLAFKDPQFEAEQVPEELRGLSQALTLAFVQVLDDMVDLDRFDLDGVMLRINRLETQDNQLVFSGYAQIEHFPGTR